MVNLANYRGLIFDMDGTLIDSMPRSLAAWQQTCEHYGYPYDGDYLHSLGGVPTRATIELLNDKFGRNHCPDEVTEYKHTVQESDSEMPATFGAIVRLLVTANDSQRVGVGTGSTRSHAMELLGHHQLLNRLNALVTACDVALGKPHPETFLTVASQMGVPPEQCIVFEDTEIGLQAAQRAGMDCVLVESGELREFYPAFFS
ncbi:HAD-IA family hydrolase [Neiella sp. HB171785]|uniref:HAD-IA family hydrolase n=1 Tax=Neiella litorisoli TaxID=2771431 RepID=A0A8J6QQS4_9GAMM|nr:HAD-IA family hydrolase [Neiella litorisoli]MBD1388999.1 HAD-IA family hydrolase [Neiella litorisoli]